MPNQTKNTESKPIQLKKKDIFKTWLVWITAGSWATSIERLQALPFCAVMSLVLEKLYPSKEELSAALKRHLYLFNTQLNWGGIIGGAVIAMEEKKANGADVPEEMITGFKTGLMGPMAGIGDTLDWMTFGPILLAVFLPAASEGNAVAAMMPLILFTIPATIVSYTMFHMGYHKGRESVTQLLKGSRISMLITGTSILGLFMMGVLSASFVKVSTPIVLTMSGQEFKLQNTLDQITPGLLPLMVVMAVYFYLEKAGPKYLRVLVILLAVGIVLGALGVL